MERERGREREGKGKAVLVRLGLPMSDAMDRHGICHNSQYVFKCPTQPLDENSP